MSTHIVILGAGFGGLELSARLSSALADDVRVTLIDKNDAFVFGFSKFDLMFGREELEDVSSYYRQIVKPGIEFRQELVVSIDPAARTVKTERDKHRDKHHPYREAHESPLRGRGIMRVQIGPVFGRSSGDLYDGFKIMVEDKVRQCREDVRHVQETANET